MATFPIPEELRLGNAIMRGAKVTCPECTMDVRFINTWHDPVKEKDGAASLFDAGAQVVFTGADTPAVADVAQEKGKWGVTYDHPGVVQGRACLTAPYWIWGPEYARIAEQVKAKTYKAGYEYFDADSKAMGLFGFMDGETPSQGRRRACRPRTSSRSRTRSPRCWPASSAGSTCSPGPIKDNKGKELLPAGESSSSPTSTSSRPAHPGRSARPACTGGTRASRVELPALSAVVSRRRRGARGREPRLMPPRTDGVQPGTCHDRRPSPPPAVEASRHRQAFPGVSPTTTSTSTCGRARSTRCWARTAPARAR